MQEETKQSKLSVEPYKGTRDFYPEDQFIQNYIFGVWRKVCELFGYQEYNASILEETALYKAKSGEEIVNEQTYSFTDRGGRDVTIRPEMTPTVARMVAQKRKELTFPLRWFSMPNLFRYERPQRGRLREHWQLNADLFGVEGTEADVEIICLAYGLMKEFGATDKQFEIRVNSRKFLNYLADAYLSLSAEEKNKIFKLVDRMHKMEAGEFDRLGSEILKEKFSSLKKIIHISNPADLPAEIQNTEGVLNILKAVELLQGRGITNVVFDPGLMRGFDYYDGIVFEVYDLDPKNNRSLFGGGRYDNLVGIFGAEKVSGLGFGMGDVTIRDFMETHELLPVYRPTTQVYVCHLEGYTKQANELADFLRSKNVPVAVDLTDRKVTAQVKTADKQKIPFVVVVGENEVKNNTFELKHLPSGEVTTTTREDISSRVLKAV